MANEKIVWKNRVVERPRTYRLQQNADGTVTIIPEEGEVYEAGTPVNADNLNKLGMTTIAVGPSQPDGLLEGDWWFKEV